MLPTVFTWHLGTATLSLSEMLLLNQFGMQLDPRREATTSSGQQPSSQSWRTQHDSHLHRNLGSTMPCQ
ncbi:hypothetical protein Pan216_35170 [Planctomycetes bacterium Pan216]|uniref:Uncharacterized protein n=1 Tax=Kolteria novifilia TaxID=2527975 RepID=A0A518B6Q0_9BACT|nr:hypothetical protein Pan216_35170 [Planctomycetes bacterium Pan216]